MQVNNTTISVVRGSLLEQDVDVIVNAANQGMRGGGGIDGRIHSGAGSGLLEELRQVAPQGAPTGTAVLTGGHNLKQPHIIHTPGPRWGGGRYNEAELLASCYRASMQIAHDQGLASIGFCSISTGIYGYPLEQAAPIALDTVIGFLREHPETKLKEVRFAMFGAEEYEVFKKSLAERKAQP